MHNYRVTLRKVDGSSQVVLVRATSESSARAEAMRHYDGRIITVERIF